MYGHIVEWIDVGIIVDVIKLDFCKVFDVMNLGLQLRKFKYICVPEDLLFWIGLFLGEQCMHVSASVK